MCNAAAAKRLRGCEQFKTSTIKIWMIKIWTIGIWRTGRPKTARHTGFSPASAMFAPPEH
jgi:hypothetical protein